MRRTQEFDDFFKFFLLLLRARNVRKTDFYVALRIRARFSEVERLTIRSAHRAEQNYRKDDEKHEPDDRDHVRPDRTGVTVVERKNDVFRFRGVVCVMIRYVRRKRLEFKRCAVCSRYDERRVRLLDVNFVRYDPVVLFLSGREGYDVVVDVYFLNLVFFHHLNEFSVGYFRARVAKHEEHSNYRKDR